MKKSILLIQLAIFISLSLIICGCTTKSSAKNKDIIEQVYGDSWTNVKIFKDTETEREYIMFQYGKGVAVTPRLPKEDKE